VSAMNAGAADRLAVADADLLDTMAAEIRQEARTAARRQRLATVALWVLLLAVALAVWELAAATGFVDEVLSSRPSDVLAYLAEAAVSRELWEAIGATMLAATEGLLLGSVLGIGAAVLLYEWDLLRRGTAPFIAFLNALPRPALAPIFVVWFGLGIGSKVAVSASIVVFVVLLTTLAGLDSTHDDWRMLSRSLRMRRRERLLKVQLPAAIPTIVSGLRICASYSVLGVVISELVASTEGLGQLLIEATNSFNMAGAFGLIVVIGLIATALDRAILQLEKYVSWTRG
jgi:NitT/TauT family transport system permease protein